MRDTSRTRTTPPRGFSLIELATALLVLAIITAVLMPIGASLMRVNRANETITEASRIYTAVVGDPQKNVYGYVGDTGVFPSNLMDLVQKPASVNGWNGPYLTDARVESGVLYDPYGSPYECYYFSNTAAAAADQFVIMSRGPDRGSSNLAASNVCTKYNGSSMPTTYGQTGNDVDNVVYPRFTDNPTLLAYNHVGTLSIAIFNFDQNSLVNTLVPGCPHLYTITVASVSRTTNDTFTMPYNPGANSVDLPQGLYKVSVTSPFVSGALWTDQVVITPGATISRTANLYGSLNSSSIATQAFGPFNAYGSTLTFLSFSSAIGNVTNLTTGAFGGLVPRACSQINAQTPTSQVIDAFVLPYFGATTYNRKVNSNNLCTLTILNSNVGVNPLRNQVLVYDSGVFVGIVTSRGQYKSKIIYKIKQGNLVTVYDTATPTPALLNTAPGTTMGCDSTITV